MYAFWERLACMAQSVCVQIAERLLRRERVSQFATRFRPDGLSWSVVLLSASSHFVNGWCAVSPLPVARLGAMRLRQVPIGRESLELLGIVLRAFI